MSTENDNISRNGWTEYGKLVLNELKRLNDGQDQLKSDIDKQFKEIHESLSQFKSTEKDVYDLKEWKEKVNEVWSVTQMKESKDEIYIQKNRWLIVIGVGIAVQILWVIFTVLKDKII
jgi:uncharacterized protein YecA (UPF0149 family)